jgi:anti-sigma regulatory factor (Ser/Thr protein kinase)
MALLAFDANGIASPDGDAASTACGLRGAIVTVPGDELHYLDRAQGLTSLTLAAAPAAIGRARQLVRFALSLWGLAALADDAELVASELMTNAVEATGATGTQTTPDGFGTAATVQVRVLMYQASIIIEVWDRDPGAPHRQETAFDDEGGRGLMIVAALCKQWDFFGAADGGKVVWAELAVPAEILTPAGLPRRARGAPAITANRVGLIHDPALLRRVHRALKDL